MRQSQQIARTLVRSVQQSPDPFRLGFTHGVHRLFDSRGFAGHMQEWATLTVAEPRARHRLQFFGRILLDGGTVRR